MSDLRSGIRGSFCFGAMWFYRGSMARFNGLPATACEHQAALAALVEPARMPDCNGVATRA
jgi:hypothetical protein